MKIRAALGKTLIVLLAALQAPWTWAEGKTQVAPNLTPQEKAFVKEAETAWKNRKKDGPAPSENFMRRMQSSYSDPDPAPTGPAKEKATP